MKPTSGPYANLRIDKSDPSVLGLCQVWQNYKGQGKRIRCGWRVLGFSEAGIQEAYLIHRAEAHPDKKVK